jgi:hypothetical protein
LRDRSLSEIGGLLDGRLDGDPLITEQKLHYRANKEIGKPSKTR